MRIISDFHDYYDSVMGYSQEYDSIWLRKPQKVGMPKFSNQINRDLLTKTDLTDTLNHRFHLIGFCGSFYLAIRAKAPNGSSALCYTIEDLDKFVEENFKKKQVRIYHEKRNRFSNKNWRIWTGAYLYGFPLRENYRLFLQDFDEYVKKNHEYFEKLFLEYNTPVIIDSYTNACLRDLEFYRIKDAYTAYQEINMFLSQLKSPEKSIPLISDTDMLEAKGFDPKWSFRKEPSKKRKKK